MKSSKLIICLLLLGAQYAANAQGLTPSTVRQIFSLEKGDSIEYQTSTLETMEGCGTLCNIYRLDIIDSTYYNTAQDTLFIAFNSQVIYEDTFPKSPIYGCDICHPGFMNADYFLLSSGLWIVTDLDSSIRYLMDTIYGTVEGWGYLDSVYINRVQYNGSKQNVYGYSYRMMSDFEEIYADSLGIVYKTEENQTATNNTEQLIYYHKANGKLWGTPYVYTGIKSILDGDGISVCPNPTDNEFVIHSSLYQGLQFRLFDALSKQVMNLNLSGEETEVRRNNLPTGIYFWQISDGINVIKTGKLILE